ncbi:MAG: hypothetical protein HN919_11170 [Verrucomicrobia bacterium]|jgi:hypothetical protein|nr:hypothetical protein [Verrucomicrobiota bacterium]MBT7066855.1 hypothetical protein [Verrucomicrobiota bacterium]MBT7700363.1 hypothetical protein [Verrucomicrobiota bacterium]
MICRAILPVAALLAVTLAAAAEETTPATTNPVHAAASYIMKACTKSGQFRYRINTDPTVRVTPKYNMLRHAGTIYALASYDERYPSPAGLATLTRAVDFMQRYAIGGVGSQTNMLAVWSRPHISGSDDPLQAKLGGAGLGLVALLSARRAGVPHIEITTLRKLARFILFMQDEDGRLVAKYVPSQGGRCDNWVSLYYPGEAALGLVMLYEIEPNPEWLDGATQALTYLARSREGEKELPADHWALLATHRLLQLTRSYERSREDPLLRRHANRLCDSILAGRISGTRYTGFTGDGRICPTATRMEGLIAALPLLSDPRLKARALHAVTKGAVFLRHTQLKTEPWEGAWTRAATKLPADYPNLPDSFNRRATEIRIDYVQHALSALLMYEALVTGN